MSGSPGTSQRGSRIDAPAAPGPVPRVIGAALAPYLVSRLVVIGAAVVTITALSLGIGRIQALFTTWDGQWYVSIAEQGYIPGPDVPRPCCTPGADTSVDGGVAFFPLYPMILGALGAVVPGSTASIALIVSFIIGGAAAVTYTRLAMDLRSEEAARRSVLLFCFFPGAFVLSFAYPEGLVILLASVCLLALRRHSWIAAGFTAALASATRPNGLALTVACAVAAWEEVRTGGDRRSIIAPIIAPMGFVAFIGYLWLRTGEPGYWFRANRLFWHDQIGRWPELEMVLGRTSSGDRLILVAGLAAGFLLLTGLVIIMFRANLPVAMISYALAYEAMALLSGALAVRPRFILAAFPLVMAAGFVIEGNLFNLVLASSAATMIALLFFYAVPGLEGRVIVAP